MEEVVNRNVFDVIISSILGSIAFITAWVIRNTVRANNTSVSIATMIEANKNQSKDINDIKNNIQGMRSDLDTMYKAIAKEKTDNNNIIIRVNKVLKELE